MKLNRIYAATMAPSPSHMKAREEMMEVRNHQRAHRSSSDDNSRSKSGIPENRISTIPELTESFERRLFLRDERTTSLTGDDDETLCLICHEDMKKSGGPVQELHCSHRSHKECMELWKKQTCPSCRVHVFMPRRLYWSSSRINVP